MTSTSKISFFIHKAVMLWKVKKEKKTLNDRQTLKWANTLLSGSQPNRCEVMRHCKTINLKSTFPCETPTLWCGYLWVLIIAMGTSAGARVAALWIEQTDPKPISNCAVHSFKVWHLWWRNGEFGYKWSSVGKGSQKLPQSLSLLCPLYRGEEGLEQWVLRWARFEQRTPWLLFLGFPVLNVYIQWHMHAFLTIRQLPQNTERMLKVKDIRSVGSHSMLKPVTPILVKICKMHGPKHTLELVCMYPAASDSLWWGSCLQPDSATGQPLPLRSCRDIYVWGRMGFR